MATCTARKRNAEPGCSEHRCRRIKGHKGKHKCKFNACAETGENLPLEWSTSSTRARR